MAATRLSMTRGLFRIWVFISVLWVAGVTALFLTTEPPSTGTKPPSECIAAKNADECAKTLMTLGKNPFEAFGYVGREPVYGERIDAVAIGPYIGLGFLPPTIIFVIGAGLVWALKGFVRQE